MTTGSLTARRPGHAKSTDHTGWSQMRLVQVQAEVELLINRLKSGRIDLQPDFQRGSVWPIVKKQRLVDSILRNWHVPPLHFIRENDGTQSVLDGQQRLTAIWEFYNGLFDVNGKIDPRSDSIGPLDGLRYGQLPNAFRHAFLTFPIQTIDLIDYSPEEPYELFFRLNEPLALTSAEKRNAFFGPARDQVRALVEYAATLGWSRDTIGFTNSRMAYDDIIARLCLSLEMCTLREQLSGAAITRKYRSGDPFRDDAVERARTAIRFLSTRAAFTRGVLKFNRATLFSWLAFLARLDTEHYGAQAERYLEWFHVVREALRLNPDLFMADSPQDRFLSAYFDVYRDRSSSRVLDAVSVLARDAIIWALFYMQNNDVLPERDCGQIAPLVAMSIEAKAPERVLYNFIESSDWGSW
ncbi:DUF262 domain-containing protein [Georgenia sp. MJ206]|uniref:DUF262 domain-containing protein n=1 Tax=Georgenia wangjunii TaxID=3117730 RepID=UPI002F262C22